MSSKILEIFDAFAAMQVQIDLVNIPCHGLENALNSYQTAHLPIRVITPITRYSPGLFYSNDNWNSGLGSVVNQMNWTIVDVLLYEAIAQRSGPKSSYRQLVTYVKDYTDQLANGALLLPENCWVESVVVKPDIVEYPFGSGNFFYGAVTIAQVKEKVPR